MAYFLTKFVFDPRHPLVPAILSDNYNLHRLVCQPFADGPLPRLLYRFEEFDGKPGMLVSSPCRVNWGGDSYWRWDTKEVELSLTVGQRLGFRLIGNTIQGDRRAKRITQLQTSEQRLAWLDSNGGRHGFKVVETSITRVGQVKSGKPDGPPVVHTFTQFDGVIEVLDPSAVKNAVERGVGRGKAFGLGMLTVRPA